MAAPNGIIWGSIVNNYGRIGIYVKLINTETKTTRHTEIWFWSKYSVNDVNNTLYYNDNAMTATTNKGNVSIHTTVDDGDGWSTSNQVMLKSYDDTFTRTTKSIKRYTAAGLMNVDKVGLYATMNVNTSYTIPALERYTIKYNANGGSEAPSSQTKYYGESLTLSNINPIRTGYIFKGWSASSNGNVAYTSGSTYTDNTSITLYAVWQVNTYTIKYNANGGTGAPSSQTKTHNVKLTLSSTIPTRTSSNDDGIITTYVFKGWATDSSATTVSYAASATYTVNASVTLYAVWGISTITTEYMVSYNTNGGLAVSSQVKKQNVDLTLRTTIPTKKGYTFKGWGLSEDATTVSYTAGATYTNNADIVLYAIWTPWTHTVNFDLNGGNGTIPSSFVKTTDVDVMISESNISKESCVFKCWSTNPSGSKATNYYVGDAYTDTKDGETVTLYAIWKERKILIYQHENACGAVEFVETDNTIGFDNIGTVYASEFIEDDNLILGKTSFHFNEIIER